MRDGIPSINSSRGKGFGDIVPSLAMGNLKVDTKFMTCTTEITHSLFRGPSFFYNGFMGSFS